jgi:CheY-like chemotaxis protein/DNA-binding XRE family transcriptional regulator
MLSSAVKGSKDVRDGPPLSLDAAAIFGGQVKAQRQRLGLTQEELAWRANMHRTNLANIERGGRNITLRSIANLAFALQVTPGLLLEGPKTSIRSVAGGFQQQEILLVEDSKEDAELAMLAFKKARLANPVKIVSSGAETLDYLLCAGRYAKRQFALPQLVLLDLKLIDLSGQEVLRQLKAQPRLRDIPVVVLSGSRSDRDIAECIRLGAKDYILKPLDFDGLGKITSKVNLHWSLGSPKEIRPKVLV